MGSLVIAEDALNNARESGNMRTEGSVTPESAAPKAPHHATVQARRSAFAEAMSEALRCLLECGCEHAEDCPSRAKK